MNSYKRKSNNKLPEDVNVPWFEQYLNEQKSKGKPKTKRTKEKDKRYFSLPERLAYYKKRKKDYNITKNQRKYAEKREKELHKRLNKPAKKFKNHDPFGIEPKGPHLL
jgi:hypothetical protein